MYSYQLYSSRNFGPLADTLKMLADRAALFDAGLVTTEKDWVRLSPAWRAKVTPWPVRARFEDEAALAAVLTKAGL